MHETRGKTVSPECLFFGWRFYHFCEVQSSCHWLNARAVFHSVCHFCTPRNETEKKEENERKAIDDFSTRLHVGRCSFSPYWCFPLRVCNSVAHCLQPTTVINYASYQFRCSRWIAFGFNSFSSSSSPLTLAFALALARSRSAHSHSPASVRSASRQLTM